MTLLIIDAIFQPIVTAELLRQAISYLVAEADLPFSIVKQPSFNYLLELLNPQRKSMEYGHKSIKNIIDRMFMAHTEYNQKMLASITHLSFTVDAWTSPNMKAFMAITAHGITPDWQILDLLIAMPSVEGIFFSVIFISLLGIGLITFESNRTTHWRQLWRHAGRHTQQPRAVRQIN